MSEFLTDNQADTLQFPSHNTPIDDIEYVYIQDDPMERIKDSDRRTGSFWFIPMRTGYDKVFYGTGFTYASGLISGGVVGVYEGFKRSPNRLFKVQFNSIINQTTRYGPWYANTMALGWATLDNLFWSIRGTDDYANHIAAGFTTGLIFKSTQGLRTAVKTGSLLALGITGFGFMKSQFDKKK
ncbi:mitochondrial import inner membrane translocase, subunit timm23 [Globomyces sp. JEL0801]|nr:mitochondrial import inner membrane translocase, subunit timm23 [Globomyces sp. JEL0801]